MTMSNFERRLAAQPVQTSIASVVDLSSNKLASDHLIHQNPTTDSFLFFLKIENLWLGATGQRENKSHQITRVEVEDRGNKAIGYCTSISRNLQLLLLRHNITHYLVTKVSKSKVLT